MYKRIIVDGKDTNYLIYDDGRVYSEKVNRFLNWDTNSGYARVLLCLPNKKIKANIHLLVAQNFIPNPNNLPIVHHKDGNKLNNSYNNLEWISYSDNVKKENRTKHEKIEMAYTEEELKEEKWMPFRDTFYSFSNLGRMKNNRTSKIIKGHINPVNYYIRDMLSLDEGHLVQPRHRLVYESFHPNEIINIINHKDGVRYNNRLSNLENVSYSDNLRKAYTETKTRRVRHCLLYNDVESYFFFSISEASSTLKIHEATIRGAIKRKGAAKGYYAFELSEDEYYSLLKGSETIEKIIEKKNLNE